MLEKQEYLEVGEEKYPLAVTLNVIETMQNKYGTITKWKKLMLGFIEEKKIDKKGNEVIEWKENDELSAKDLKFFVMESINEGIDIENEKRNEKTSRYNTSSTSRNHRGLIDISRHYHRICIWR